MPTKPPKLTSTGKPYKKSYNREISLAYGRGPQRAAEMVKLIKENPVKVSAKPSKKMRAAVVVDDPIYTLIEEAGARRWGTMACCRNNFFENARAAAMYVAESWSTARSAMYVFCPEDKPEKPVFGNVTTYFTMARSEYPTVLIIAPFTASTVVFAGTMAEIIAEIQKMDLEVDTFADYLAILRNRFPQKEE